MKKFKESSKAQRFKLFLMNAVLESLMIKSTVVVVYYDLLTTAPIGGYRRTCKSKTCIGHEIKMTAQ